MLRKATGLPPGAHVLEQRPRGPGGKDLLVPQPACGPSRASTGCAGTDLSRHLLSPTCGSLQAPEEPRPASCPSQQDSEPGASEDSPSQPCTCSEQRRHAAASTLQARWKVYRCQVRAPRPSGLHPPGSAEAPPSCWNH